MSLVGAIRAASWASRVRERAALYEAAGQEEREAAQLEALNREWRRVVAGVPHYRDAWVAGKVPEAFRSLDEFRDALPVVRRDDVQRAGERMTSEARPPDTVRATGGSTARPVRMPAWRSEDEFTRPDVWYGRSWYGVTPADRLFMIWGHSHLLGQGLAARVRGSRRRVTDALAGYRRFSAYDLRPAALRRACDEMLRWRPGWLLGYSVALDMFAVENADRRSELRALGLKAVVATAEALPRAESADELSDLFGTVVAMEYGAVETSLMAHTHPDARYRVFWRNYLLDAERGPSGHHVLRVTSLYPRSFPLVRYEIGDEVTLPAGAPDRAVGLAEFDAVRGRCNDYVSLRDGAVVHSEAFSHVMRACGRIRGFQVVARPTGVAIRYVSDAPLVDAEIGDLRGRLRQIHAELESAELIRVETLPQTVAGKTRMVVAESEGA